MNISVPIPLFHKEPLLGGLLLEQSPPGGGGLGSCY